MRDLHQDNIGDYFKNIIEEMEIILSLEVTNKDV